ncbi:MAG: hypothetical protein P8R42_14085 [Candidatus Binatia bacterium]|nr:hypothetical protein [Candidatus Binatia bacterium]
MIEPAARDYYEQKGISFGFQQLLRVLDDRVSIIDPTGFLSDRDTIVEDAGYHRRLLDYVRRFRVDPASTFPGFIAYCHKLPADVPRIAQRPVGLKEFPTEFAADQ